MSTEKQYDNELKFRIFKADKGDNPKRPDYRGTIRINGVDYKLSGWLADMRDGKGQYIRGQAEVADASQRSAPAPQTKTVRTMSQPQDFGDVRF